MRVRVCHVAQLDAEGDGGSGAAHVVTFIEETEVAAPAGAAPPSAAFVTTPAGAGSVVRSWRSVFSGTASSVGGRSMDQRGFVGANGWNRFESDDVAATGAGVRTGAQHNFIVSHSHPNRAAPCPQAAVPLVPGQRAGVVLSRVPPTGGSSIDERLVSAAPRAALALAGQQVTLEGPVGGECVASRLSPQQSVLSPDTDTVTTPAKPPAQPRGGGAQRYFCWCRRVAVHPVGALAGDGDGEGGEGATTGDVTRAPADGGRHAVGAPLSQPAVREKSSSERDTRNSASAPPGAVPEVPQLSVSGASGSVVVSPIPPSGAAARLVVHSGAVAPGAASTGGSRGAGGEGGGGDRTPSVVEAVAAAVPARRRVSASEVARENRRKSIDRAAGGTLRDFARVHPAFCSEVLEDAYPGLAASCLSPVLFTRSVLWRRQAKGSHGVSNSSGRDDSSQERSGYYTVASGSSRSGKSGGSSAYPIVRCVADLVAVGADDLPLKMGDEVVVTKQDPSGWWYGHLLLLPAAAAAAEEGPPAGPVGGGDAVTGGGDAAGATEAAAGARAPGDADAPVSSTHNGVVSSGGSAAAVPPGGGGVPWRGDPGSQRPSPTHPGSGRLVNEGWFPCTYVEWNHEVVVQSTNATGSGLELVVSSPEAGTVAVSSPVPPRVRARGIGRHFSSLDAHSEPDASARDVKSATEAPEASARDVKSATEAPEASASLRARPLPLPPAGHVLQAWERRESSVGGGGGGRGGGGGGGGSDTGAIGAGARMSTASRKSRSDGAATSSSSTVTGPTIWQRIALDRSFDATVAPAPVRPLRFACAIDTFVASDAVELSLMQGAIVQILADDGSGWLRGELVGVPLPPLARPAGWFPASFVAPVVCQSDGTFVAE